MDCCNACNLRNRKLVSDNVIEEDYYIVIHLKKKHLNYHLTRLRRC